MSVSMASGSFRMASICALERSCTSWLGFITAACWWLVNSEKMFIGQLVTEVIHCCLKHRRPLSSGGPDF